jgi:soluble lytic murein transglycosylase-like protein
MWLLERTILAALYLDTFAYYSDPVESLYYAALLGYECGSQGIDPLVGAVIIHHESGGDAGVISHAGGTDTGLMQIVPAWQPWTQEELKAPAVNIHAGCKLLSDAWHTYGKGEDGYLAYFAGGGSPNKAAWGFSKWVKRRVKKAEKIWHEVPEFFDGLRELWDEMWEELRIKKVS